MDAEIKVYSVGNPAYKKSHFFNEAWSSSECGRNNNDDNNEMFTKHELVT